MESWPIKPFVLIAIALIFSSTTFAQVKSLPEFTIITEDWRPYQYLEGGELKGFSVDVLERLLKEAGSKQDRKDFRLQPWARGVRTLENTPNSILFLMTRTPERNSKYKWVGPLFKNTSYVFAKKERGIVLKDDEHNSQYTAGSIIEDVSREHLLRLGIKENRIHNVVNSKPLISMLYHSRIDVLVDNLSNFVQTAKTLDIELESFEIVGIANENDVAYAFNIETPDSIIDHFQEAFQKLLSDGEINAIKRKYDLNETNSVPSALKQVP